MGLVIGKRKRTEAKKPAPRKRVQSASPEPSDSEDVRDAFRRAFEAQFKPLAGVSKREAKDADPTSDIDSENWSRSGEGEGEEEDEEWGGISEDEKHNRVEVVEVSGPQFNERASKDQLKAFMSSKPPPSATAPKPPPSKTAKGDAPSDDETESANLKNDLALQRLLSESHLLDASSGSMLDGPVGKNRLKALDLRFQSLGSKNSVLAQEKMPMSHRKGITSKAKGREQKRRHEARENGIILEKEKKEVKTDKRRERGVGAPAVGRFSGGTLNLSRKDVADIVGGGGKGGKKGKRR
ncbi:hypothetical protein IWX90DRAFT_470960 [Phyllosticta citrichinensis]|uniref:Uncharacterized protein n=1 Tax=Phyllosticta citrichinensis TaxID=1130410 RepID=A0ABR1XX59_9PEZI